MFDIGFWEIALIGVIALLVVGPERLPALARNVGLWVGRMRRYVAHVRDDIEREINAEEVRKLIETPSHSIGDFDEVISETKSVIKDAENQLSDIQREADKIENDSDPTEAGSDINGPFSVENTEQLNPTPETSVEPSPETSPQTNSNTESVVDSTAQSRPVKP